MDAQEIRRILESVSIGNTSAGDAFESLGRLPYEDVGDALLDHHRAVRTGFPEVVYGPGKTPVQLAEISKRLYERSGVIMVTRTDAEGFAAVKSTVPDAQFNELGGIVWADRRSPEEPITGVAVVTAGTADLPVAEEASETARLMGCDVVRIVDVGVAGLHRTLGSLPDLRAAKVLVVVAGMEGALPSVIAGLVKAPVIAAPTSTGYGASFGGVAALLAMLNSCAAGIAVVNIDNGFGAGVMAAKIARSIAGRD
ncbi:MAG TPA: nickel pincer cofactor biosynthesis protein LarB [Dehalococcoidia bacterium]|nr:1-(5-phosphoribosyl)-5-amino-4-imidazole-carboxylate carboxylase [Chloroflexota bacterium]MDP5876458.1 nickel pincer cofactor biosynthesis protein LarB [Dehalococcoidia bacterium]MDP6273951.1 nickel pincer cofactor biosynthesis protein LarB [Dehalococcoidia bacterium]MDP7213532.1 nickel pincer cofactor biosynthesis protein LarB [Dehalococcoidia bacterium]MDP7514206.1 nickel pincer cofactor biosynthesis protein LarB [Dehalococcoidia bacterium]